MIAIRSNYGDTSTSCSFDVTSYNLADRLWSKIEERVNRRGFKLEPNNYFDEFTDHRLDVITFKDFNKWQTAKTLFSITKKEAMEIKELVENAGLKRHNGHACYPTKAKLNKLLRPYFKTLRNLKK